MRSRPRGRPPQRKPEPDLEALGRFGRLVAVAIVLEVAFLLWETGAFRPLG